NNYTVTFTSNTAGVITPRPITVTAAPNTKVYDGTTAAAATPTVTSGSLPAGDTPAFTETYDTTALGTRKTLTPCGSVSDGNGGQNDAVTFVGSATGVITARSKLPSETGVGTDAGSPARVVVLNPNGTVRSTISAFNDAFTGGARVALGDVNGDGKADTIIGS